MNPDRKISENHKRFANFMAFSTLFYYLASQTAYFLAQYAFFKQVIKLCAKNSYKAPAAAC